MARKNYTVEQIIAKLRQIDLHYNQGKGSLRPVEGSESRDRHIITGEKNTVG